MLHRVFKSGQSFQVAQWGPTLSPAHLSEEEVSFRFMSTLVKVWLRIIKVEEQMQQHRALLFSSSVPSSSWQSSSSFLPASRRVLLIYIRYSFCLCMLHIWDSLVYIPCKESNLWCLPPENVIMSQMLVKALERRSDFSRKEQNSVAFN